VRHLPAEVKIHRSDSGYFLWLELPPELDAGELSQRALAHQVSIAPAKCSPPPESWTPFFRFNASWQWGEREERGVILLGKIIREMMK
jgi:DNA-binding transcriptional MocR family regulator